MLAKVSYWCGKDALGVFELAGDAVLLLACQVTRDGMGNDSSREAALLLLELAGRL